MATERLSSGCSEIDMLLEGGYENDILTAIYGSSGSGKTNLCLICAVNVAKERKKVIYIDTEGGFSVSRLNQIAGGSKEINDNFLFLRPVSFNEQKKSFEKLKEIVNAEIGLIIVDTIAMLYRIELGKNDKMYETNRELGKQVSYLTEIARKKKIPIIMTNQVYSGFDEQEDIRMVGGDIIKYGCKCIIELKKTKSGTRIFILKKHRSIAEGKKLFFRIVESGIEPIEELK